MSQQDVLIVEEIESNKTTEDNQKCALQRVMRKHLMALLNIYIFK